MRKLIYFFSLLFFNYLASMDSQEDPSPVANFEFEPCSLVGNVNVITGAYQEFSEDLVIVGPEPLAIQRAYCSMGFPFSNLQGGWNFNHQGWFKLDKHKLAHSIVRGAFRQQSFFSYEKTLGDLRYELKFDFESMKEGLTNCAEGEISGRFNRKNQRVVCDYKKNECWLYLGTGGRRFYCKSNTVEDPNDCRLRLEEKPNGNQICYQYNRCGKLKKIETKNKNGKTFAWAIFKYPDKENMDKDPYVRVQASDGRQIAYHLLNVKKTIDDQEFDRYALDLATCPGAVPVGYSYTPETKKDRALLTVKIKPDYRFTQTEYYDKGSYRAGKKWIKVDRDDKIYRRVKRQLKAVGVDATPFPIHTFVYKLDKNLTEVYDAYYHPTFYYYTDDCVLKTIKTVTMTKINQRAVPLSYRSENFYWGAPGTGNEGNLTCRTLVKHAYPLMEQGVLAYEKQTILACKSYLYDKKGNILQEGLWGNLTGKNEKPIVLDDRHQAPIENGCERHFIDYAYSEDRFNLLVKETHPNGKIICYQYQPETDLMTAKLTYEGKNLRLREFYAYNEDAVLTQTIRDDGQETDCLNLNGVTERHVARIHPKQELPGIGLPVITEEFHVDLRTGELVLSKKIENAYDPCGRLIEQRHYDQQLTLAYVLYWEYDSQGRLIVEKDALGQTIVRRYDDNGHVVFEQGPCWDHSRSFVYDFADRLVRTEEVDCAGARFSTAYSYDLSGNRVQSTDRAGHTTRYAYDSLNRLTQTVFPAVLVEGSVVNPTVSYAHDQLGNQISQTDARGFVTRKSYNVRGQATVIEHPDGSQERSIYTTAGKLAQSIDQNGSITLYDYDLFDRLIRTSQWRDGQLIATKTACYSTFHLLKETDEAGLETLYRHDQAGRLVEKLTGDQRATYHFDSLGRQSSIREWTSPTDYLEQARLYDLLDRVVEEKTIDQSGTIYSKVSYEYSADGQRTAVATEGEAGSCVTRTVYNLYKQPLTITDAEGNQTTTSYLYVYHPLVEQHVLQTITTDPLGHQILTTYDALDRVATIEERDQMGETIKKKETYYDLSGNKIKIEETVFSALSSPYQVVTIGKHDALNRLIELVEASGSPEMTRTLYAYNAKGQKESIMKPDGCLIFYAYDPLGRLVSLKSQDLSIDYQYAYQAHGSPIAISDLTTGGLTERFYDSNHRLIKEILQNGLSLRYDYDGIGRPVRVHLEDGSSVAYAYEGPYLSQAERISSTGDRLYRHVYEKRDRSGNPIEERLAGEAGRRVHVYDRLGRAVSTIAPGWQESDCAYNKVGSLIKREVVDCLGATPCSYEYDALNQLKEERGGQSHRYAYDSGYNRVLKDEEASVFNQRHELIAQGDCRYFYDNCGNCVQTIEGDRSVFYAYDALNRLISATKDGQVATYQYDSFNRRTSQMVNERVTCFLYANQNEIGSYKDGRLAEFRLLGTGKGAEIGAAVAIEIESRAYVPLHDASGNVACLLDLNGEIVETYRYSAYGEETVYDREGVRLGASINPWRFSSKRCDPETGLTYFGARYYHSRSGRWLTPDPLGQLGGSNLYAYVCNNPLTHSDHYGLLDWKGFFSFLFNQLFSWVGRGLILIGQEIMPFPIAKDAFTIPGHICRDGHLDNYVPSYRETHSYNGYTGVWQDTKVVDIFTNGMRTSQSEIHKRYGDHSEFCNGSVFHYTYNAMHGLVADVLEWTAQRVGIPTHSVYKLTANVREKIESLGGVEGGGRIRLWAHSQGGEMAAALQGTLTKEELGMIEVKTYGSANLFHRGHFAKATHYISERDWVPLGSSPVQYLKACYGYRPDVIFLPCSGNSYFDHAFEGKTYSSQFRNDTGHIR